MKIKTDLKKWNGAGLHGLAKRKADLSPTSRLKAARPACLPQAGLAMTIGRRRGKKDEPTQLEAIRELMLRTSRRGSWLTLEEIAERTEFGATSISAQLRHLRKRRFGRYVVSKRRRSARGRSAAGNRGLWEYGVFLRSYAGRAAYIGGVGGKRDSSTASRAIPTTPKRAESARSGDPGPSGWKESARLRSE